MLPTVTPRSEIAMGSVMPTLGVVVVALRLCSKRRIRRFGIDDWLVIVSAVLALGLGAVLIIGALAVEWNLSVKFLPPDFTGASLDSFGRASPANDTGFYEDDGVLLEFIFDLLQIWALGTAKLSVIFFYRSIFCSKTFNITSWTMVGIVIAWILGAFLAVAFQCAGHFLLLWSSAASIASHCSKGSAIGLGFSIPDVITDGLILMMPLYWTWKLHMPFWRKVGVSGVFLFGAITIVASIIRLIVYVIQYPSHNLKANQVAFYSTIVYWSMLEIGLSVIAACLPTLAPLFRDFPTEQINKLTLTFFTPHSRSSDTVASVSETRIVRKVGAENDWGIESYAMGDIDGHHGEEGDQSRESNGQILITTGISRHSIFGGDEV